MSDNNLCPRCGNPFVKKRCMARFKSITDVYVHRTAVYNEDRTLKYRPKECRVFRREHRTSSAMKGES